ncbi:MAG TPA: PAS domain-containing sensor histidine kinase [Rhizomicrobium sp.]|jgi:two-component system nitrogen regulation sensor histidine kinase NtrY|nr:PAS domain-containing sensor histidine kinase [Rhizomicrobium sp.]
MALSGTIEPPVRQGFFGFVRSASWPSRLAIGVLLLAIASGALTYATITGFAPYNATPSRLIWLLLINLALVLALGALIAWRLVRLWSERRSGMAGARLHTRLVAMFSTIAVIPTIFVAIFAAVTLNLGLQAWFSNNVKEALGNAVNVAERYESEHEKLITADAYQIAYGIEGDPQLVDEQGKLRYAYLFTVLANITKDRGLQASYIYDSQGNVLGSTKQRILPEQKPPALANFAEAAKNKIVIDGNAKIGVVRALIRLQRFKDAYLMVVRAIDPTVFGYYQRTVNAVSEYNALYSSLSQVQLVFALLYAMVSGVVLLAAIWLGLWAANRLVQPISHLISAAERVTEGDLKAQVVVGRGDDELGILSTTFNRMTSQLDAQRTALIEANRTMDERRRFTEAVLAGVSAGVIGIDSDGTVSIVNRMAARLLGAAPEDLVGQHYSAVVPELADLIGRAMHEPVGRASGEASVKRGKTRLLSVQVSSEPGPEDSGYVATFDDITDLVSAQRTAAWADVARRIAHEIKNPLTPIQLSAERLKRKYGKEVTTDPEVFSQCTDTIIRQVGDIGRMVDEFSSFARMPQPTMRRENAQELAIQAVFLQREGNADITYESHLPKDPIWFEVDGRLVSQALTNVLKNAGEAIASRRAKGDDAPGRIALRLVQEDDRALFKVTDNGIGLPHEERHRLTEPYVTTRAKGTGLGLAIVKKIAEDHGGELTLADAVEWEQGAEVTLAFPLKQKSTREKGVSDEQERIADRA